MGLRGHRPATRGSPLRRSVSRRRLNRSPTCRRSREALRRTRTVDPSLPCAPIGNSSQRKATVWLVSAVFRGPSASQLCNSAGRRRSRLSRVGADDAHRRGRPDPRQSTPSLQTWGRRASRDRGGPSKPASEPRTSASAVTRQIKTHPDARPEPSRSLTGRLEADPLVEPHRVRVRDHIDMGHTGCNRAGHDVVDKQSANPESHRFRLDEQIVELPSAGVGRLHDGEAEAPLRCIDRHSYAPVCDRLPWRLDRVPVVGQLRTVLLPHIRRPALERLESRRFGRKRIPDALDGTDPRPVPFGRRSTSTRW